MIPFSKTQGLLNDQLFIELESFKTNKPEDILIKNRTIESVTFIQKLVTKYDQFAAEKIKNTESLKEKGFAKKIMANEDLQRNLSKQILDYTACFPPEIQNQLIVDLGFAAKEKDSIIENKFILEAPNGAIPSILKHLQTVMLKTSTGFLTNTIKPKTLANRNPIQNMAFLQSFKRFYYVGEKIQFNLFSDGKSTPSVFINNKAFHATPAKNKHILIWHPLRPGKYEILVQTGGYEERKVILVTKPNLRFIERNQEITAYVSEPFILNVDLQGIENMENLTFTSSGATIEKSDRFLKVIPLFEGRFSIEMRAGNKLLDSRSIFALKGAPPQVVLKDIAGEKTTLSNAHCLEAISTFWQVVNFRMTIISLNGEKREFKSMTRYLRNELTSIEKSAPTGSTIIFDQIRLLNANGITTAIGSPIFLKK